MEQPRNYTLPGGLSATRCQPAIGAVVSGIDLAQPLSEAHAADLRSALFAHGVIFLTGQAHIGFAQHLALAEVFGTPICDGPDPGRPQITPVAAKAGSREGTASSWHSDGNYQPEPPLVSILCGGLDYQIEHHLFPTLAPPRLRQIASEVRTICLRHGLTYKTDTWRRRLGKALGHIKRLTRP